MFAQARMTALCLLLLTSPLSANTAADTKKQLKLSPGDIPAQGVPVAEQKKIVVFKSEKTDGTALFSDRQPLNRPYTLVRYDCFACNPTSTVNWHTTPLYLQPYNLLIAKAATDTQLDPALIRAVIHAESAFRPNVISKKGAIGLMQLMPQTAEQLGVTDASAPEQNIIAGSRYLAQLLAQHQGDVTLALAAYNAGAGNVRRYNGVPPFAETRHYIERVNILHKRYQRAG